MKRKGPRQLPRAGRAPGKLPLMWMSFADPDKPDGQQFLGVVILRARDVKEGIVLAHRLKINPGGEVQTVELPPDCPIPEDYMGRLLTREDTQRLDVEMRKRLS